ncbi:hypothetical protein P43SY_011395 [Pythium insidiosum]|uniref:Sulfatase N-terminal domain-containing protein n=1 Tax=Pythium insidiosum TaxID=114742 RepID=A0AAD5Q3N9_PYTIN|nr:hypothetical protein P43SY_011395 [Pythium insidiosum]
MPRAVVDDLYGDDPEAPGTPGDHTALLASAATSSTRADERSPVPSRWLRVLLWAPAVALPMGSRLLLLRRNWSTLPLSSVGKGLLLGAAQDAAVFLQALVLVRVVLALHRSLRALTHTALTLLAVGAVLSLCTAFLWLSFAPLVDVALLVRFMPRLNRGFVRMYLDFSSQFTSSLREVITLPLVLALVLYVVWMLLWAVVVFATDARSFPRFSLPFSGATHPIKLHPRLLLLNLTGSVVVRTFAAAVFTAFLALHCSVTLDGNENDLYLMSNAMYSLQWEGFLRSPPSVHVALAVETSSLNSTVAAEPPIDPVVNRSRALLLGDQERFNLTQDHSKFPFWRQTLGFQGAKRFELLPRRDDRNNATANSSADMPTRPAAPPNILLINVESFRSREVGVIGGRHKKAKYNQTVTPFFDQLSRSGVLFREHYTPCVQTSRSLLSTLFGILPSWTFDTVLSHYRDHKYNLRSIMQILKDKLGYESVFWSATDLGWEGWDKFLRDHGFDALFDFENFLAFLPPETRESLRKDERISWGFHDRVSFSALVQYLHERHQSASSHKPLFVDVYTISSHDPWHVPGNYEPSSNFSVFLTEHNKRYVNALNYADQQLEKLFANLRSRGLLNNTIVLIEGDHGHGFMEHNNPSVTTSKIYDEMSHIPLLLLADDLLDESSKGVVVDETTSALDLLSTFADMLGIENFMQHGMGQSLMRRNPSAASRPIVLENPFEDGTQGMRRGDLKFALFGSGRYAVHNLSLDPWEEQPVEEGRAEDLANGTTLEALATVREIVGVAQLLFATNGFRPEAEPDRNESNHSRSRPE